MNPFKAVWDGAGRLAYIPVGVAGRYRPFYALNVLDRVQGRDTLEHAVKGKVVMVTGASSGIGRESALRLGKAGATVVAVARSAGKLDELAGAIADAGGSAGVHAADLADMDDVDRLAGEVLDRHGRVDVLVNNAGRSIRRSVDLSYDRFHDFVREMQLNYFGPAKLILAFLPGMREAKDGHIVNVSTAGVQVRPPKFAGYVASKAALDAFSESVAADARADGVRVTTVYMPLVRTPMIVPTTIYRHFPALTPEQAADLVCDAVTYRPPHVGTLQGFVLSMANIVSPWSMDQVRGAAAQLFPDSAAAHGEHGEGGEDGEPRLGAAARVFASVLRGIHW